MVSCTHFKLTKFLLYGFSTDMMMRGAATAILRNTRSTCVHVLSSRTTYLSHTCRARRRGMRWRKVHIEVSAKSHAAVISFHFDRILPRTLSRP